MEVDTGDVYVVKSIIIHSYIIIVGLRIAIVVFDPALSYVGRKEDIYE